MLIASVLVECAWKVRGIRAQETGVLLMSGRVRQETIAVDKGERTEGAFERAIVSVMQLNVSGQIFTVICSELTIRAFEESYSIPRGLR